MANERKDKVGYISGGSIVKCPFFRAQDARKIYCESVSDGMLLHLTFELKVRKNEYCARYCGGSYTRCPYYRINDAEYDEYGYKKT